MYMSAKLVTRLDSYWMNPWELCPMHPAEGDRNQAIVSINDQDPCGKSQSWWYSTYDVRSKKRSTTSATSSSLILFKSGVDGPTEHIAPPTNAMTRKSCFVRCLIPWLTPWDSSARGAEMISVKDLQVGLQKGYSVLCTLLLPVLFLGILISDPTYQASGPNVVVK